jgi:16S rRNA (uracil1498-N3)-methyltransferase
MPDFRVHCRAAADARELLLSPEESFHLVIVNRAREGDPVTAFDGRGREWDCTLGSAKKTGALLTVRSTRQAAALAYEITLAQAMPKGPCMDAIVRKATEIGARRIIAMETSRTQVKLEGGRQEKKTGKWETAALEAAKQCGNPWLPDIVGVVGLEEALEGDYELRLVASLHPGALGLKQVLAVQVKEQGALPRRVLWLVGPEGDFSPEEMSLMAAKGVQPVTLGPLVLRCETAAVYALSILSHELAQ